MPQDYTTSYRSSIEWSADQTTVTKRVAGEEISTLLPTRQQSFHNEWRVMAMLNEMAPPIRLPRLHAVDHDQGSLVLEAIPGEPIGPKRPTSLDESDLEQAIAIAGAIGRFSPPTRHLYRLPVTRHLRYHYDQGSLAGDDAVTIAAALSAAPIRWCFAHGDFSARNLIKESSGALAVIDWERTGLYPAGYDLALLWYTTGNVAGARPTIEAAVLAEDRASFLFSALLIALIHLDLSLNRHPDSPGEPDRALAADLVRRLDAIASADQQEGDESGR